MRKILKLLSLKSIILDINIHIYSFNPISAFYLWIYKSQENNIMMEKRKQWWIAAYIFNICMNYICIIIYTTFGMLDFSISSKIDIDRYLLNADYDHDLLRWIFVQWKIIAGVMFLPTNMWSMFWSVWKCILFYVYNFFLPYFVVELYNPLECD